MQPTDNLLWFVQPSYNDSLESFKRLKKKKKTSRVRGSWVMLRLRGGGCLL